MIFTLPVKFTSWYIPSKQCRFPQLCPGNVGMPVFFFPARLRFDQGWSKSWFRWCGDSSMLHPFLYLGPRKSRGVFVFCWMQGTRGAQLGQHSMVMVSTGTTLLDVLFCCLQIRWSEKFVEVEAFFQWYNNYHLFQHRFESLPFFSQKQNLEVIFFHNRSTRWWIY